MIFPSMPDNPSTLSLTINAQALLELATWAIATASIPSFLNCGNSADHDPIEDQRTSTLFSSSAHPLSACSLAAAPSSSTKSTPGLRSQRENVPWLERHPPFTSVPPAKPAHETIPTRRGRRFTALQVCGPNDSTPIRTGMDMAKIQQRNDGNTTI